MSKLREPQNGYLWSDDELESLPDIDMLFRLMQKHEASDCFLSEGAPACFKIEGRLHLLAPKLLESDDINTFLAAGLSKKQLETFDRDSELNCGTMVKRVGRFRFSAFKQRSSKAVVIRFIPLSVPDLNDLGLPAKLSELAMLSRGLIIVVGQTGSGKSTTLAAMIQHRARNRDGHVLTIEDPIEYVHQHAQSVVNQREVGADTTDFATALRNAMRQAPDVLLIGEIRDMSTMTMALQYAQTGHLCLATLHANNASHALQRIVGFYPPDSRSAVFSDLSSSLAAVISQRLVRGTSRRRAAAVELMVVTRYLADAIRAGDLGDLSAALETESSRGQAGSQTFEDSLLELVKQGRVTPDDAVGAADSDWNMYQRLTKEGLHASDDTGQRARSKVETALAARSLSGDGGAALLPAATFGDIELGATPN